MEVGITTAAWESNREFIIKWMKHAVEKGAFEEQALPDSESDSGDSDEKIGKAVMAKADQIASERFDENSDVQRASNLPLILPSLSSSGSQNPRRTLKRTKVIFIVASVYNFNLWRDRIDLGFLGFPYLEYYAGEVKIQKAISSVTR